jgi:hypothetical protein
MSCQELQRIQKDNDNKQLELDQLKEDIIKDAV